MSSSRSAHQSAQDLMTGIRERRLLQIRHHALDRLIEPYLLYASKAGDLILHGRQIGGEWDRTPPPDWCNLRVAEIDSVRLLAKKFRQPHSEYNPKSSQFYRVLAATPKT